MLPLHSLWELTSALRQFSSNRSPIPRFGSPSQFENAPGEQPDTMDDRDPGSDQPGGPPDGGMEISALYEASVEEESIALLINGLGGNERAYRRERKSAARRILSEIYSPPRVTQMLSRMPGADLLPGFALDLTCIDPHDGEPWDFDRPEKRERARFLTNPPANQLS